MVKIKNQIKNIILKHLKGNVKIFIFGSSVKNKKFSDIDVGIIGKGVDKSKLNLIREDLENSIIPYKIDLVDFNEVSGKFKEKVFRSKILWII